MDRINLHDFGYVELLDMMGDDMTPVRAARVSYNQPLKGIEPDTKLLRYLMTHDHWSPFEQVALAWEIKLPIFVSRQILRHRTARLNEFSMRYADAAMGEEEIDFYVPEEFLAQDAKNKQASAEPLEEQGPAFNLYITSLDTAAQTYRALLNQGVSREQARAVLPVATYTKMVWQNDLRNTLHFLRLRLDKAAQPETRDYALAMRDIMRQKLPIIMSLWEELNSAGHGGV